MKRYQPLLGIVITIFILVLIVPSILVVSFSSNTKEKVVSIDRKETNNNNSPSEPSIEVSVYRTSSKDIEKIPLEEYVVGVVASEMPTTFELEALKAQSLAARTFVVNLMLSDSKPLGIPKNVNADIGDNHQFHQVYKNKDELTKQWGENYKSNINKIQKAVNATKGQILTYTGNPIDPSFFSTSNGYTENSEDYWTNKIPYLRSVASPWDKESPKFTIQKVIAIEYVERALEIQLDPNANNIGEVKLTKSKRVDTIKIGNKEFSGKDVREILGLSSSDFDIQQKNGNLIFTTRGNGHGVGMSQYGANGMAKEGKSYKDIVKYYYQGIEISSAESFLNTMVVKK
jgi:stage II sporulation protein D